MGPGALETALALYQSPSLAAATRLRAVPDDVFEVIRIAAGEIEAIDAAVARSGCPTTVVCEASQLYLKHVLFDPDADHYRVLGVGPDADDAQMREHRRWLLKWLHPDRADEWDAVYAARVQQAWQQLRDPVRRSDYDQSLAGSDDRAPAVPGAALRPVWTARTLADGEGAPSRVRPGPWVAAAGVALVVVGVAGALWLSAGPRATAPEALSLAPVQPDEPRILERVPLPPPVPGDDVGLRPAAMPQAPAEAPSQPRAEQRRPLASGAADASAATVVSRRDAGTSARSDAGPTAPIVPTVPTVPSPSPSPSPAPAPDRIDVDAVEAAMAAFQAAYERGDIEALMGVFTPDAQNRRGGREAIRQDYTRLFRSSRQRRLQWHSLDWTQGPDNAVGEGGFVASITPRRGATNTVRGRVRVEVVQRGRQVRIRELWHEDGVP